MVETVAKGVRNYNTPIIATTKERLWSDLQVATHIPIATRRSLSRGQLRF